MNPFKLFFSNKQRHDKRHERQSLKKNETAKSIFQNSLGVDDNFSNLYIDPFKDTYLCNAWVNIAVEYFNS